MFNYYNIKFNTLFIKNIDNRKFEKINSDFWKADNDMDICEDDINFLLDHNKIIQIDDRVNYIERYNNIEIKSLTYYFYFI